MGPSIINGLRSVPKSVSQLNLAVLMILHLQKEEMSEALWETKDIA